MKKGVIFFIVLFLIMITGFFFGVCYLGFYNFANFTKRYETDTTNRYLCECGISRGIWLLDEGHEPEAGDVISSVVHDEDIALDSAGVHLTIYWNSDGTFNITSASGTKTLTILYDAKRILSWE